MARLTGWLLFGAALAIAPANATAQVASPDDELRRVMADFVRGWREGDAALLSSVLAMDEGRIAWVSGQGADERVSSMTFRAAVDRGRVHPEYGREGWEILSLDIIDDELAVAKLRILEGDAVNIDYMVCLRVAGQWRIVSNTFVIQEADG